MKTMDTLRKLTEEDLALVLSWRNDDRVRLYMFTQHQISAAEHETWFRRVSKDASRHLLLFERNGLPLGFVNLQVDGPGRVSTWGFYLSPEAPKGTGQSLGHATLRHSFQDLGLHKLYGQTMGHNVRSIRLHEKLGFQREGVLRSHHFDGNRHHDVICFGLLRHEWHNDEARP